MGYTIIPYTIFLNNVLFGQAYFNDLGNFLLATIVLAPIMSAFFLVCSTWAVFLRFRFPLETEAKKRMSLAIGTFILMSAVTLSILLRVYEYFNFLDYRFNESHFLWGFACLAILNVFLTFLQEGISRFEKYRSTLEETEALKRVYKKSQLMGLKSQMNPHFLFNSLNTLSSLIHENPDKAENFLDDMSKVFRYLLRNSDDTLVSLGAELGFIQSYYALLKSRYGQALQLSINVPDQYHEWQLPPLTLQMIFENVFNQNRMSKEHPLIANISIKDEILCVVHNIQPRIGNEQGDESGLENICEKFRLLGQKQVNISVTNNQRTICLPLFTTEMVVA